MQKNATPVFLLQHHDEALLLAYQKTGTPELAAELFQRYFPFVFNQCFKFLRNRADAEDACMQVFEKVLRCKPKDRVLSFCSWLAVITRNECLSVLRKRQKRLKDREQYGEDIECFQPLQELQEIELRELNLLQAVLSLKKEQRMCIELFYFAGKRYQEITEICGFSLKEVKSYLQNGRRNLRRMLK